MRSLLLLGLISAIPAADVITVDATSQVIVAGSVPTIPAAAEVRIGGGTIVIGRTAQAGPTEAVRGNDARLTNARTASGGTADTATHATTADTATNANAVGGIAAAALLRTSQVGAANGVASLDGSGKVPLTQLPVTGSPGGAAIDGAFSDGPALTAIGYSQFSSFRITTPNSVSCCSVIRVTGNAQINALLTVTARSLRGSAADALEISQAGMMNAIFAVDGATAGTYYYGGSCIGAGAGMPATAGLNIAGMNHFFLTGRPLLGGHGAGIVNDPTNPCGHGGGSLTLLVDGDLDCTNGTIQANGTNTNSGGPGSSQPAGGGGGSITIICSGTITGGQFLAQGGIITPAFDSDRGGGGGLVQLIASAYAGTPTVSVIGGTGPGGNGAAGLALQLTYAKDQIRTILTMMR